VPLYRYHCDKCNKSLETIQQIGDAPPLCSVCGEGMRKMPTFPALIRIKGQGYPSRRKWMENWTPDSPPFSTGSLHGERY